MDVLKYQFAGSCEHGYESSGSIRGKGTYLPAKLL